MRSSRGGEWLNRRRWVDTTVALDNRYKHRRQIESMSVRLGRETLTGVSMLGLKMFLETAEPGSSVLVFLEYDSFVELG